MELEGPCGWAVPVLSDMFRTWDGVLIEVGQWEGVLSRGAWRTMMEA